MPGPMIETLCLLLAGLCALAYLALTGRAPGLARSIVKTASVALLALGALLAATRGRIGDAARRAGLSERSLYNMMQRYAIRKESFRRGESS